MSLIWAREETVAARVNTPHLASVSNTVRIAAPAQSDYILPGGCKSGIISRRPRL